MSDATCTLFFNIKYNAFILSHKYIQYFFLETYLSQYSFIFTFTFIYYVQILCVQIIFLIKRCINGENILSTIIRSLYLAFKVMVIYCKQLGMWKEEEIYYLYAILYYMYNFGGEKKICGRREFYLSLYTKV